VIIPTPTPLSPPSTSSLRVPWRDASKTWRHVWTAQASTTPTRTPCTIQPTARVAHRLFLSAAPVQRAAVAAGQANGHFLPHGAAAARVGAQEAPQAPKGVRARAWLAEASVPGTLYAVRSTSDAHCVWLRDKGVAVWPFDGSSVFVQRKEMIPGLFSGRFYGSSPNYPTFYTRRIHV
jgi:hypothetical protein